MPERQVRLNSFVEGAKRVLVAPINYALELRHRTMNMGDKILMGEIVALEVVLFLATHDLEGKFSPGSFLATNFLTYLMAGVVMSAGNNRNQSIRGIDFGQLNAEDIERNDILPGIELN